jgi:hypothetical protein
VERLTKKELRALLECIKECYPICDLETFGQRVVSRLSKFSPGDRDSQHYQTAVTYVDAYGSFDDSAAALSW